MNNDDIASIKSVVQGIRKLMDDEGVSKKQVSIGSRIPEGTLKGLLEVGKTYPSFETIVRLANYFQVPTGRICQQESIDLSDVSFSIAKRVNGLPIDEQEEIEEIVETLIRNANRRIRNAKRSVTAVSRHRNKIVSVE